MVCFCRFFYQVLTSKKLNIFLANKVAYQSSISNYGIIRRTVKKTVVVIYKAMYTEHCENTLKLNISSVSTMNHLIDCGLCALAGCTHFTIVHNYSKKVF